MRHDYIYSSCSKPRVRFLTEKGKWPKDLHFGFEYEINRKTAGDWEDSICGSTGEICEFNRINHNWTYWKWDGSCDIEVNSLPFNWNFYKTHETDFRNIFRNIVKISDNVSDCGFHIHMSRKYFTVKDINRMLYLVTDNKKFFTTLSGRGELSMEDFASIHSTPKRISIHTRATFKHSAVHLTSNTIEFRLFNGTRNPIIIQQYLEFCLALALFVRTGENDRPTLTEFQRFLRLNKFKLAAILIKKRCRQNRKQKRK